MLRSAYELQSDLHRIQSLLHQESFLFLTSEEKKRLLDESLKLDQRLNRITESFLVVGLLGGTGTGKSSLMNALACSPIAAASHRRPHTDQVLIYRHGAAPIPAALNKSSYPWREIVHEAEAVRQIILCDLPDFDSLLTKHREQVLQFLENLDILVWVTSPEKYADERFYAFLRQVSKARENFYFILNKVDLLFQPQEPEAGYLQLANLTARFSQHLGNNGIAQPIIYAVSTREGCDYGTTSPWNQLGNFRSQIFRLRDAREVTGIKAANLDVEVKHLAQFLEKEVLALTKLQKVLSDSAYELQNSRSDWSQIGKEVFKRVPERSLEEELVYQPGHPRALVGAGYVIAVLAMNWTRITKGVGECVDIVNGFIRQQPLQSLRDELERLESSMTYRALHQGLPPAVSDYCKRFFDANAQWSDLLRRFQSGVVHCLENRRVLPIWGFRGLQYGLYLVLFLLLLLALGGETAWRNVVEHPDWYTVIGLVSAVVRTLFSPNGLAALGSYVLLQIFLGLRFYGRYKKFLQRHAQRFIESLRRKLGRIWEEELNILIAHLKNNAQEVEGRITSYALCRSEKED